MVLERKEVKWMQEGSAAPKQPPADSETGYALLHLTNDRAWITVFMFQ
jgi:hypothetical protein